MRGASAGALTATLAACSVNVDKAIDCAQRLAQEHRLFERSIGLTGKPLQNAHVIADNAHGSVCLSLSIPGGAVLSAGL